jgi:hypothetical protein
MYLRNRSNIAEYYIDEEYRIKTKTEPVLYS